MQDRLWSSGQNSWLQIQRSGFDSRRYHIFLEVVGLERGPLSLVSKIEKLLERKSSGSGLEIREYGRMDPSRWPRGILRPIKLELTSPTSGGRSVAIVRSLIQATEFSFCTVFMRTETCKLATIDLDLISIRNRSPTRWVRRASADCSIRKFTQQLLNFSYMENC
jgi:hypothetical protein